MDDIGTEGPDILEMDFKTFHNIKLLLDDRSIRERFLQVLPNEFFNVQIYQRIDSASCHAEKSPGKLLLEYLDSIGGRVSDLIFFFEEINLEQALIYLKGEEPLQIIEQPEPNIHVNEGEKFIITCKASSYPHPEYQWFKDDEELLLHGEQDLLISPAKVEDGGIYWCKVSKRNVDSSISWLLSDPATVTVSPCKSSPLVSFSRQNSKKRYPNSSRADKVNIETKPNILCEQSILPKKCPESEKIVIVRQPRSYEKVPQGSNLWFRCIGKASHPVKYQWYKNGRPLEGQTTTELYVAELYPDQRSGRREFKFFCEVYNKYDKVISDDAIVKLSESDHKTKYVAEEKIALLIANDKYEAYEEDLVTPAVDVLDLALLFKSINFKVIVFRNLNLREMKRAFRALCTLLKPGSYVVVFFAGHGFECCGQTYFQPIDCRENLVPDESLCAEFIVQQLQETDPALIVLFIDACRKSFPELENAQVEKFKVSERTNTVYAYATSFLNGAYESPERNSYFVKHLKKYITHDKSIQEIIIQVQRDFDAEPLTRNIQNPVLKSGLSSYRKLCDELRNPLDSTTRLFYQESNNIEQQIHIIPEFNCYFIVEIKDHMDVFLNGVDVNLYIYVKEDANLDKLGQSGLIVALDIPDLQVRKGVRLQNAPFNLGSRNLIIKEEVLDLQRLQNADIRAQLVLKLGQRSIPFEFSFTLEKIKSMRSFFS